MMHRWFSAAVIRMHAAAGATVGHACMCMAYSMACIGFASAVLADDIQGDNMVLSTAYL
jgi:hypothetical protein